MEASGGHLLTAAIAAIERKYRCHVCFHDYTGGIYTAEPELSRFHENSFCSALKERHPRFTDTCISFDRDAVQRRLAGAAAPFFKYCLCGLLEAVIPVYIRGKLSGAMFAGPFRFRGRLPGMLTCGRSVRFPDLEEGRAALAELAEADAPGLLALGELLAYRLAAMIEDASGAEPGGGGRREMIDLFMMRHFKNNIGLGDLAEHLGLSSSRTSQLVKTLFGGGFNALLNRYRLEHAASLLRNSRFKIATVAGLSGFHDAAYFHRVFRREFGTSPLACRRQHLEDTAERDGRKPT